MKKILLFGGALALLFPYDASCGRTDSGVNENVDCKCKGKDAFDGFSIALSPVASRDISKAPNIEDVYDTVLPNVDYGPALDWAPTIINDLINAGFPLFALIGGGGGLPLDHEEDIPQSGAVLDNVTNPGAVEKSGA